MKQKFLAFLLAGAMALGLAACGTSAQTSTENTPPAQTSTDTSQATAEPSENRKATIENTALVNQDGIVITAQEMVEDEIFGTGVKLLIEKHSSENQTIGCDYAVVNDFMMTSLLFSADVATGKKTNETLYFPDSVMKGADITTIADMHFVFYSLNPNTYERRFTTEEVSLSTSASGKYEQPLPTDGQELYNQNGIRIVGRYVDEDDFLGTSVVLFIQNTGDTDLSIACDNMSINGFMVTPYLSALVNSGKMSLYHHSVLRSRTKWN